MGILDFFSKSEEPVELLRLPSGSFTIDGEGELVASTLPRSFPESHAREIGARILEIFRNARKTEMPLTEIVVNFSALKITARELRGGAIIFLAPDTPN